MRGKCIHPRKMVNTMKEFLEQASDMTYNSNTLKPVPEGIDFWEWMCEDKNWELAEYNCAVRITKWNRNNYCACLAEFQEENESVLHFCYSQKLLRTPYEKSYFETDFRRRFPTAKGFMGITITLLHELGHFETDEKCYDENPNYNRLASLTDARAKAKSLEDLNFNYYFKLPDERYATEWAIEWLKDAEHRKIAKAFEKKFLECFEKTS